MSNAVYLRTGKLFFAFITLAIGVIHIAFHNFPLGLLPVPVTMPGREVLVYVTGVLFILSGLMLFTKKYAYYGAVVAGAVWILFLILLHIPKLIGDIHNGGEWTATFEMVTLLSGTCLLAGTSSTNKLPEAGRFLFLLSLVVYTVLHYVYLQFIATLIPNWLPFHIFWAWVVLIAFFAATLSLLIGKAVRLSEALLALMFLLWVLILHLPRVIGNLGVEPEWTSLFICLGVSGIALLIAGSAKE
jgi:uncharacterized membrane protein